MPPNSAQYSTDAPEDVTQPEAEESEGRSANGWEKLTPEERSLKARIAANSRRTEDGRKRTEAARAARYQKRYDQTPADLPEAERHRLVKQMERDELDRMRLKSLTKIRAGRAVRRNAP
jgi:hypothetical protein